MAVGKVNVGNEEKEQNGKAQNLVLESAPSVNKFINGNSVFLTKDDILVKTYANQLETYDLNLNPITAATNIGQIAGYKNVVTDYGVVSDEKCYTTDGRLKWTYSSGITTPDAKASGVVGKAAYFAYLKDVVLTVDGVDLETGTRLSRVVIPHYTNSDYFSGTGLAGFVVSKDYIYLNRTNTSGLHLYKFSLSTGAFVSKVTLSTSIGTPTKFIPFLDSLYYIRPGNSSWPTSIFLITKEGYEWLVVDLSYAESAGNFTKIGGLLYWDIYYTVTGVTRNRRTFQFFNSAGAISNVLRLPTPLGADSSSCVAIAGRDDSLLMLDATNYNSLQPKTILHKFKFVDEEQVDKGYT